MHESFSVAAPGALSTDLVEHRRVDRDRATPLRKESALARVKLDSRFRDMVVCA